MAFWDWLVRLFGGGQGKSEVAKVREELFLLSSESGKLRDDIKDISQRRQDFTEKMLNSPTREDARVWSQKLSALDQEERGLRIRWNQVGQELAQYNQSLVNLRVMKPVDLEAKQRELDRIATEQEQRARDQAALAEMEREFRSRQVVAQSTYERAVQESEASAHREPTPQAEAADPYMQLYDAARAGRQGTQASPPQQA